MLLSLLLLVSQPSALAQPDRFGLPDCSAHTQQLASRAGFLLCFDSSLHLATWTAHQLTPDTLGSTITHRPSFRHDPDLASAYNADFKLSGYSRGHLVSARDMAASEDSLRASFLLSNAVPQIQSMNAGSWVQASYCTLSARSLEQAFASK
jgi:endonuclease G